MGIKLLIFQRILHRYREDAFYELSKQDGLDVFVAFGDSKSKKYSKYSSIKYQPRMPSKRLYTFSFIFDRFGHINQFFLSPGLLKPVRQFKPDVVITEGTANIVNNFLLCTYCLIKKIPYIWWDLGHIRGQESENPFRRMLYPIILYYAKNAAIILGYSSYSKEYFLSKGIPEEKIVVAFNTVRLEKHIAFQKEMKDKTSEIRNKIGMTNDITFLYVGALETTKRIDLLVSAFKDLNQEHENTGLIIVGDGTEKENLKFLAGDHKKIHFAGARFDDVGLYFLAGDVFVMPALGGLALNEAMAYGLPVISAPADGTEVDLVQDYETGFMIGINDEDNLLSKIKWFVEHPDRIRIMGQIAKEKVLTSHSFSAMIKTIQLAAVQATENR